MVSLIITIIVLGIIIVLTIFGINSAFSGMIDNIIGENKENFINYDETQNINILDACKKMDIALKKDLNFQTGTNIPLSPTCYEDHVGQQYITDEHYTPQTELHNGQYCAYQNELLYDGIWKSKMENPKKGFLQQNWGLTSGNVMNDFVCSDNFIRLNKPIPKDYKDCSSTPPAKPIETGVYFNDALDDPLDLQINCFPIEFDKGITPTTKNYLNPHTGESLSAAKKTNTCPYGTLCPKN